MSMIDIFHLKITFLKIKCLLTLDKNMFLVYIELVIRKYLTNLNTNPKMRNQRLRANCELAIKVLHSATAKTVLNTYRTFLNLKFKQTSLYLPFKENLDEKNTSKKTQEDNTQMSRKVESWSVNGFDELWNWIFPNLSLME